MKALPHGFETAFGVVDLAGIVGYQKCLADMFEFVNQKTAAGYIVNDKMIVDCIIATTRDLRALKDKEDDITDQIKSILNT